MENIYPTILRDIFGAFDKKKLISATNKIPITNMLCKDCKRLKNARYSPATKATETASPMMI